MTCRLRFISWVALLPALVLASTAPGGEPDWPTFKGGNDRLGVRKSVPPIRQPKVLWRADIGIQGYLNNPVLAEGKVFVGSSGTRHNEKDARDGVYCLDAATGKVLWHAATEKDACGVAYSDGRVFATSDDGKLRALAASDGARLWEAERQGELYCQPLVIGERVCIGDGHGKVAAFDCRTGKLEWGTAVAGGACRGGLSGSGERLYATFADGVVACLDLKGAVLWKQQVVKDPNHIYPAPLVLGSRLVVGYARDTEYPDPALKALDARTGELKWDAKGSDQLQDFGNIRSTPVVWGDDILYGEPYSNRLVAVNAMDGAARWSLELGAAMFPHYPSPAVAGDVLYLPRHDGGLYAVDLANRKLLWTLYLGDSAQVGPRLPEKIAAGAKECADEPAVGQPLYASPALGADGTIYVGSGQGCLYAIGGERAGMRRVKALVSGHVQGVGFRAFTNAQAAPLGVGGYVKNLKDGRVEAVIEGPADKVEQLLKAIRTGPPGSRVDGVEVEEQPATGGFRGFVISS